MSIDIKLTEQLDTEWSETGDIASVTGDARIEQGVVIRIIEEVDMSSPEPTPSAIESQRSSIEETVRNTDVTREPISVFVVESPINDRETDTQSEPYSVEYGVQTSQVVTTISTIS